MTLHGALLASALRNATGNRNTREDDMENEEKRALRRDANESATELRLEREAQERIGILGESREDYTDAVRVEVSWADADEYERAGHYIVLVKTSDDPDADEDVRRAAHPASIAEDIVRAELERLSDRHAWTYSSIDDTSAA